MGNILIEIILRFGNSFVKMKPNCRDYGLNKRSHLFFYSFWSLRLKEYHSSGRTSRRSVPNFWECRIKMFWIPHVPRSTQSCCFVFTGPGENPLFQLSFRSKPDTGAVLHQRNNKNLTACSLYNECNNLQHTDPFCFPPPFGVTPLYVNALTDASEQSLRVQFAGGLLWPQGHQRLSEEQSEQHNWRHQSGPTCVVSPLTHIAYCLTCFIFLRLFSSTRYSHICKCKELWQDKRLGRPCMLIGGGPR